MKGSNNDEAGGRDGGSGGGDNHGGRDGGDDDGPALSASVSAPTATPPLGQAPTESAAPSVPQAVAPLVPATTVQTSRKPPSGSSSHEKELIVLNDALQQRIKDLEAMNTTIKKDVMASGRLEEVMSLVTAGRLSTADPKQRAAQDRELVMLRAELARLQAELAISRREGANNLSACEQSWKARFARFHS